MFPFPWITSSHPTLFSWVGPSSSADTFLLSEFWQEEIIENLLIFLLKDLIDDYCKCSSENKVWAHCNICNYKGLIKRDWATAQIPTCHHYNHHHQHQHTHTHTCHCPRNIVSPRKRCRSNNIIYAVRRPFVCRSSPEYVNSISLIFVLEKNFYRVENVTWYPYQLAALGLIAAAWCLYQMYSYVDFEGFSKCLAIAQRYLVISIKEAIPNL